MFDNLLALDSGARLLRATRARVEASRLLLATHEPQVLAAEEALRRSRVALGSPSATAPPDRPAARNDRAT